MADLSLTLACSVTDRVEPLIDGRVKPAGINLTIILGSVNDISRRMYSNEEFDACESSMASFFTAKSQGKKFLAIPVFPLRKFRHGTIFINVDSGIKDPKDLEDARVGVWVYETTAAVWARGILQHEYGVSIEKITWLTQREQFFSPNPRIKTQRIPEGKSLDEMLVNGELDAFMCFSPSSVMKNSKNVRRLFPDYRRAEIEYYKKTGILPIMHGIIVKEDVCEKHPWVPVSLLQAFREAKRLALDAFRPDAIDYRTARGNLDPMKYSLIWLAGYIEEETQLFGNDPWKYELSSNIKTLETLVKYCYEQGLCDRLLTVEHLFPENTRFA